MICNVVVEFIKTNVIVLSALSCVYLGVMIGQVLFHWKKIDASILIPILIFQICTFNSLFVHITPSIHSNFQESAISGLFTAQLRGLDFQNIESGLLGLGAIDPYFELSKRYHNPSNGTERWQIVYRSEYIHNVINPYWDPFQLDLTKLCHGEVRRELKITVYDYETMSAHRKLGETKVTVEEFMESVTTGGNASREDALRVVDEEGDVVGLLVVLKAQVRLV